MPGYFSPEHHKQNQKLYPNLAKLDERVSALLQSKQAETWDTSRREVEICRIHPVYWMENYGFIRAGEVIGGSEEVGIIPFKLNHTQLQTANQICRAFLKKPWDRVQTIVLKHRKAGTSTLIAGFDYWHLRFVRMFNLFAIADLGSHTDNIIAMIELFHKRDECGKGLAPEFRPPKKVPMASRKKGLKFSNGSMVEQDSGENSNPGTSGTIQACHMCIAPDTPIICRDGFLVPAANVEGKKLRAFNLRPSKVVALHPAPSQEGYSIEIFGNPFPLLVTKDHRLFVREERRGSWRTARTIATRRSKKYRKWFVGYPIRNFYSYQDSRRLDKNVKTQQRPQGGGRTHINYPDHFPLTKEMGRVVGLYLAEGCIGKALKKYPAVISFACHRKELSEFGKVIALAGLPCKKHNLSGQRAEIVVRSSYWAKVFKRFFGSLNKKRIPDWVWASNPDFMKGVVHGYIEGDGHFSKDGLSVLVSSVRPQLLIQLREILLTLGYGYSCLYYRPAGYRYGRNCRAIWTLGIFGKTGKAVRKLMKKKYKEPRKRCFWRMSGKKDHRRIWLPIEKIESVWIDNPVDLEIDHSTHSYMVLGCASHNSENSKWRDPENAETSLLNSVPRVGYAFIVKESTAFGLNKFAKDCEDAEKGKSNWDFIFISWKDLPDCEYPLVPGEKVTHVEEEAELAAAYKLRPGHIKFRRSQIELLGSIEKFKQDFPLNSREPFLITGSNFFNTSLVQERITDIKFYRDWKEHGWDYVEGKYPEIIQKVKYHPRGMREALAVYEERNVLPERKCIVENRGKVTLVPLPKEETKEAVEIYRLAVRSHRYLVLVDVAEGIKTDEYTSDNSIIQVLDTYNLEQVLEWGGVFDEEVTAFYAVLIAKLYNNAEIAPEMNNKCGGLLKAELDKLGYRKLFYRQKVTGQGQVKRDFGWETTAGNKKEVCGQLRLDFKNGTCLLHSLTLLEEMLYFVDNKGKLGASSGTDDRVMAMSMGLKIRAETPIYHNPIDRKAKRRVDPLQAYPEYNDPISALNKMKQREKEAIGKYM